MFEYVFDWSILTNPEYQRWILDGVRMTCWLSFTSIIGSFLLGLAIAGARISQKRWLSSLAAGYLEVIRNTPLLVQIFFWYFGSYKLMPDSWNQWLNGTNQFEWIASALALTVYTSAFVAEDIRSGIRAVSSGQLEAALSSGLSRLQALRWVILPQAVRLTIPPLVNQFLNLTKNSSLAMTIGVAELSYQARQIESHTLKGFEAFTAATLIYLALSLMISLCVEIYQRSFLNSRQVA